MHDIAIHRYYHSLQKINTIRSNNSKHRHTSKSYNYTQKKSEKWVRFIKKQLIMKSARSTKNGHVCSFLKNLPTVALKIIKPLQEEWKISITVEVYNIFIILYVYNPIRAFTIFGIHIHNSTLSFFW